MATTFKRRDGFAGEKQINIACSILDRYIRNQPFLNALYITHIGYFPKAFFHYRERKKGCVDNILFYCISGKGYLNTHLGNFELSANQFAILPAGQPHRYQADLNDPWSIYWIHFSGDMVPTLNQYLNIEQFVTATDIRYNQQIIQLWENIYFALNSSNDKINLGYANLCLYHYISLFVFPERSIESSTEKDKITEVIGYLKQNIDKMLTVEEIAAHFEYSASHFSAIFKSKTGMAPIEYFIQLKIHYACQLLDQSPLKIKEIAYKLGYNDPFYFSRQFSKIVGTSPNDYRLLKNEAVTDRNIKKRSMPPSAYNFLHKTLFIALISHSLKGFAISRLCFYYLEERLWNSGACQAIQRILPQSEFDGMR